LKQAHADHCIVQGEKLMLLASIEWFGQPTHVRLFIVYLAVVACIAFRYSLRLFWQLYSLRNREVLSLQTIRDRAISADLLADYALANRVRSERPAEAKRTPNLPSEARSKGKDLLLQSAESRFRYLWETSYAKVEAIRRLVPLSLLLSLLTVIYGAYPTFTAVFSSGRVTGRLALYETGAALLDRLSLGIFICAILYVVSSFFEGVLKRRRACWQYFYASSTEKVAVDPD
jgi:hypothetical protein